MPFSIIEPLNQKLELEWVVDAPCQVFLKREDLLHSQVSGNKLRKLKYSITKALETQKNTLITFGGAYSNHIAAAAAAGKIVGLDTIGVIRGEELEDKYKDNPTLSFAESCGMRFKFVSREHYRLKDTHPYLNKLTSQYPEALIIPEGGTNALAIKGCEEILTRKDSSFNYICTTVGTGGTLAGLVSASKEHQQIVGYSALKGTFQDSEVKKYTQKTNFEIKGDSTFGGYAKIDSDLVRFMNTFKENTGILLDPVYTAKMMYGIVQDIKNGYFPENSRILAIHTGGLQGIEGMNQKLKRKNLPQIKV